MSRKRKLGEPEVPFVFPEASELKVVEALAGRLFQTINYILKFQPLVRDVSALVLCYMDISPNDTFFDCQRKCRERYGLKWKEEAIVRYCKIPLHTPNSALKKESLQTVFDKPSSLQISYVGLNRCWRWHVNPNTLKAKWASCLRETVSYPQYIATVLRKKDTWLVSGWPFLPQSGDYCLCLIKPFLK